MNQEVEGVNRSERWPELSTTDRGSTTSLVRIQYHVG
jgi:hypothetical protein